MSKHPSRIDLLELDIDLRLADLWREAADITEWNLEVVAAFMRAAYGKGYCDALTEDAPRRALRRPRVPRPGAPGRPSGTSSPVEPATASRSSAGMPRGGRSRAARRRGNATTRARSSVSSSTSPYSAKNAARASGGSTLHTSCRSSAGSPRQRSIQSMTPLTRPSSTRTWRKCRSPWQTARGSGGGSDRASSSTAWTWRARARALRARRACRRSSARAAPCPRAASSSPAGARRARPAPRRGAASRGIAPSSTASVSRDVCRRVARARPRAASAHRRTATGTLRDGTPMCSGTGIGTGSSGASWAARRSRAGGPGARPRGAESGTPTPRRRRRPCCPSPRRAGATGSAASSGNCSATSRRASAESTVDSASHCGTDASVRLYTSGVARRGNPARLVIALSIAGVLAIFLLYTSIAGGGTPSLSPASSPGTTERVSLVGKVAGRPTGDGHDRALRFRLRDRDGTASRAGRLPRLRPRPLQDRPRGRRRRARSGNGTFVAVAGHARDEVPVEVRAREVRRTPNAWPTSAAPRSSSRSGSRSTRRVAGALGRARTKRRLADSAGNALLAALGSTAVAAAVLLSALVRHDFSFVYVAQHTSTRAADRLLDLARSGEDRKARCSSGCSC